MGSSSFMPPRRTDCFRSRVVGPVRRCLRPRGAPRHLGRHLHRHGPTNTSGSARARGDRLRGDQPMNLTTHAITTGVGRGWTGSNSACKAPRTRASTCSCRGWSWCTCGPTGTQRSKDFPLLPDGGAAEHAGWPAGVQPDHRSRLRPGHGGEDGTLLRAKAVPHGVVGHVTGHVVLNVLSIIPSFLIILIPGAILSTV